MRGSSYTLNYSIDWLGSFPISKASLENVAKKLDSFMLTQNSGSLPVQLTISLLGVKVTKASDYKVIALQHSLRRICCVVGRPEVLQVAYITRETHDKRHRRVCHVFQTSTVEQALEIESILSKAFQAIALFNSQIPLYNKQNDEICSGVIPTPRCNININPALEETILSANGDISAATLFKQPYNYSQSRSSRYIGGQGQSHFDQSKDNKFTPIKENNKNFDTPMKPQRQLSTVKLFTKIFGSTSTTNNIQNNIERNDKIDEVDTPLRPPIFKRRSNKRLFSSIARSISGTKKSKTSNVSMVMANFYGKNSDEKDEIIENKDESFDPYTLKPEVLGELIYNEKINEMVYPLTEYLDKRLKATRYFVINRGKKSIEKALQSREIGAFLITYSSSVKHCLTISIHTGILNDGISSVVRHYVIIRNEKGFRIRGSSKYHDTIPTLVTYHSVDKEILPVPLIFMDWPDDLLKKGSPKKTKSITSTPLSCLRESENYDTYKSFKVTKSCLKPVAI
ncbi:SH2 domain and PTB/PI domain and Pleckstrin homology-like domain-containing protein [Strongyloides ratti]|uniref:SH2 domain and PTB/PI domain and Pleckstrin homology-like domain-containing protein n=1 Tax=Strongyloides ratti TaxID=34506 RepID=A0A090KRU0_STRRB|nr:SH2 domain and PTB/PI domain and Pleckstrin homology-like domain-containing protein [Strongyloides ratti]CEF60184.1 SH2 domain and PTB/PI domain and Pleckstrin homology-like domain-containing protein [Strongyloides ratti]